MRRCARSYYQNRRRGILGRDGDFITAPEISQLFGELVAAWLLGVWQGLGSPRRFTLTELGVGGGTLAADMLRVFKLRPEFLAAADWHLLEISPRFRRLSERKLEEVAPRWHHRLATMPKNYPHIIVANEFFDALPIEQYKLDDGGWRRAVFRPKGNRWFREFRPTRCQPPASPPLESGQIWEQMRAGTALLRSAARRISEHGGHLLVIDYGYDHGVGDTLKPIKAHKASAVDCGIIVGDSDLSADVDFHQLRRAAADFAVMTPPLITQANFLRRLGLRERLATLVRHNPSRAAELGKAAARLVAAPMGEMFKVMAVASERARLPAGVFAEGG